MIEKKFLLMPGEVESKNDGEVHYISASQLMRLYRVDPRMCTLWRKDSPWTETAGLIPLRPRYDGNYEIPKVKLWEN